LNSGILDQKGGKIVQFIETIPFKKKSGGQNLYAA
jgi:hypothetical protein